MAGDSVRVVQVPQASLAAREDQCQCCHVLRSLSLKAFARVHPALPMGLRPSENCAPSAEAAAVPPLEPPPAMREKARFIDYRGMREHE